MLAILGHQKVYSENFKFFNLVLPKNADKYSYTDVQGLNYFSLRFKDPVNILNISTLPIPIKEHQAFVSKRQTDSHVSLCTKDIIVNGSRRLNCFKRDTGEGICNLVAFDYFNEISYLYEFTGNCRDGSNFFEILSTLNYSFDQEQKDSARNEYRAFTEKINSIKLPIPKNATRIKEKIVGVRIGKKVTFVLKDETKTSEFRQYYKNFFMKNKWEIISEINNFGNNTLISSWADRSKEVKIDIIVTPEQKDHAFKDSKILKVTMVAHPLVKEVD
ncbi:MAG: hypothetical protein GY705_30665 [Bacteroidetes bacterium]|nr:hypothetical protein [Bacteroidota bacterium]